MALIINNKVFSRSGSKNDIEALRMLFKALYFEVIIEKNLRKEKILKVLDEVANVDHNAYDCFVLCLMSHGKEGVSRKRRPRKRRPI